MSYGADAAIADGVDAASLRRAIQSLPPGERVKIEMSLDHNVTAEDTDELRGMVNQMRAQGLDARMSTGGNMVSVTLQVPDDGGRVGFPYLIVGVAVAGILASLVGWRILTTDPVPTLRFILPFALVAIGGLILYKKVTK